MKKRYLKLMTVPAIYTLAIVVFAISMYLIQRTINTSSFESNEHMEYVDKEIVTDNEYIPVIAPDNTILKPFMNELVTISKPFYDYTGEKTDQEKSIIIYKDTYMQNSGVDYKYTEVFDVISILDGTVIDVVDNDALGKTVKIRHDNDLVSTYQSLSEISVKKDDMVLRGQIIGKSGTCNIYPNDSNLHFELSYQGKNINPETSYHKTSSEL
jgi:stage II sporulation protein Q